MPSEGPLQGRREAVRCSAPPFSFLLINSPASLISPDEMRPREHCPPRSAVWRFNYPPSGRKEGLAGAELHPHGDPQIHTLVEGWLNPGRARSDPAKRQTLLGWFPEAASAISNPSFPWASVHEPLWSPVSSAREGLVLLKLHQPISLI